MSTDERLNYWIDEMRKLQERILELELPIVEAKIIEFFRSNPDSTLRDVDKLFRGKGTWLAASHAIYDRGGLISRKVLVGTSHGRGRLITYRLREE